MSVISVKCRKCRILLLTYPEVDLLTGHGESYQDVGVEYINCGTIQEDNVWYLGESGMPDWISSHVNKANWTKGRVNCPNCNSRLGSFDFVSGSHCKCGLHILPPIHIVKYLETIVGWLCNYLQLECEEKKRPDLETYFFVIYDAVL